MTKTTPTHRQMIEDCLTSEGLDTTAPNVRKWVKKKYGMYIAAGNVYHYRKELKKKTERDARVKAGHDALAKPEFVVPPVEEFPITDAALEAITPEYATEHAAKNYRGESPAVLLISLRNLVKEWGYEAVHDMLEVSEELLTAK